MQVPRLQVEDPCTWPVILGHEAAHLALLAKPTTVARIDADLKAVDWSSLALSVVGSGGRPSERAKLSAVLKEIGRRWAEELLCDAYAVRRYGPAAVAALASFLDMLGTMHAPGEEHPPGDVRVSLMLGWLGSASAPRIDALLEPWRQATRSLARHTRFWNTLITLFTRSLADPIWKAIDDWPAYAAVPDRVNKRADRLLRGRPGLFRAEPTPAPTAEDDAEAVNAAWVAVVEQESVGEAERVPVERLAAKALDIHEFLRLWHEASDTSGSLSPLSSVVVPLAQEALHGNEPGIEARSLEVYPMLPEAIGGASVDLRLGSQFIVFRRISVPSFDPVGDGTDPRSSQDVVDKTWGQPFVLHPGELALASTLEYLVMPDGLMGQVGSRSSMGRIGLIPATAVLVHPGFRGCLTLELVNAGTVPILLTPGQRIAQLSLHRTMLSGPQSSRYDCPTGPEFSKISEDREIATLAALRARAGYGATK
jgi:deoxycytidine triphosphate deaminase